MFSITNAFESMWDWYTAEHLLEAALDLVSQTAAEVSGKC